MDVVAYVESNWIQEHIYICINGAAVCIECNEAIMFLYGATR
jgi:hypothetical protein